MMIDPLLENIIIGGIVGIPSGILTGILVKKYAKSTQERIFENNREKIIHTLLWHIGIPFAQMPQTFGLFARQNEFVINKQQSFAFSDNEFKWLVHYYESIQEILKKFPSFHDCSTFVSSHEYLAIKKYIMSSLFFVFVDGSAVGLKNQAWYDYKVVVDHALFAKEIIDYFKDYGLSANFIQQWTETLSNEGMLYPNYKKVRRVPGDLVPQYHFDSELLQ